MTFDLDSALGSLLEIQTQLDELNAEKAELVELINQDYGDEDSFVEGTKKLEGSSFRAKLNRRQNVSFPRRRGSEHPLLVLVKEYPEIVADRIRIEPKESGKKLRELIKNNPEIDEDTDPNSLYSDEAKVTLRLLRSMIIKAGTPSVTSIEVIQDEEITNI